MIKGSDFVESYESEVDSLLVVIRNPIENNSTLMKALLDAGIKLVEFAEEEVSLEDLYLDAVMGGGQK